MTVAPVGGFAHARMHGVGTKDNTRSLFPAGRRSTMRALIPLKSPFYPDPTQICKSQTHFRSKPDYDSTLSGRKVTAAARNSCTTLRVPQAHSAVEFPFGSGLCSWSSSAGMARLRDIGLGAGVITLTVFLNFKHVLYDHKLMYAKP